MQYSPTAFKRLINCYPPYLGAGIKVTFISEDWCELHVSMALRWYNRNAVGTHFGGNLYSMVDPHLMLLLMKLLGKGYWVWDKSAHIEFVKATQKRVTAIIKIAPQHLEHIKRRTANGDKCLIEFPIEIKDEDNDLIAIVKKTLYLRRKR
jgi:acyl-coenzyme A thioesterase PaaI-like protein